GAVGQIGVAARFHPDVVRLARMQLAAVGALVVLRVRGHRQKCLVDVRRARASHDGAPVVVLLDDHEHATNRRAARAPCAAPATGPARPPRAAHAAGPPAGATRGAAGAAPSATARVDSARTATRAGAARTGRAAGTDAARGAGDRATAGCGATRA